MNDFLKISRGGMLSLFKHNPERQRIHRCKKVDDKYIIKNENKEIIAEFNTEREQNLFFFDNEVIDFLWNHLRDDIFLEEGVTLSDILRVVEENEELKTLVTLLFPNYPSMQFPNYIDETPATNCIVFQEGNLKNDVFERCFNFGWKNNRNFVGSTIVELNTTFDIYLNNWASADSTVQQNFSLFELLQGLFQISIPEKLILTKSGLRNIDGSIYEGNHIACIMHPIELAEDFTLGDLFKFTSKSELLTEFIKCYSWCNSIDEFHKQALLPNDASELEIWHLEIYRDMSVYVNGHIDFNAEFHGIGELSNTEKEYYDKHPEIKRPNHTNYSVSCSRMNHLAHLPLHLNEELTISNYDSSKSRYGKLIDSSKYKTTYTLLDVLDAVYWDISFYGGPEQADEFKEEMESRVAEILEKEKVAHLKNID